MSLSLTVTFANATGPSMLLLEELTRWQPPLRELVGAGEPLNPEMVERIERAWGVP
ncbi:hypothetical protein ACEZDB_12400 [Streptacidiphilus sp. N1-3]|uniref:Uncharacterized protein n=1 Tax=Streptacidiphilus alkalitolerans TaxID=3342712 RepID=A0ABV6X0C4_9ACTN